jgi:hypothetical protein
MQPVETTVVTFGGPGGSLRIGRGESTRHEGVDAMSQ